MSLSPPYSTRSRTPLRRHMRGRRVWTLRGESYTFVISNPASFLVSNVGVPCLSSLQDYASLHNLQCDHFLQGKESKTCHSFSLLEDKFTFRQPLLIHLTLLHCKVKASYNEAEESSGQIRLPTRLILEGVTKNPRRYRRRWGFRFRV